MADVRCVHEFAHALGESPVWHAQEQALYWVNVHGPQILRLTPSTGEVKLWTLPDAVGSIGIRAQGGLIAATKRGFHVFDTTTGTLHPLSDPESHLPDNRFNDGRCDRRGRFWSGTMSEAAREPLGSLYCIDADLRVKAARSGIIIPNSLCWSPDDRVMYFADTYRHKIWAYDYDIETGTPSNERVFVDLSDRLGKPDGSTVDAQGYLWNCQYSGGRVCRYAPDGTLDRTIELPVTQPTSCAFGGPGLQTLYITSARQNLTPEQLAKEPLAGALFAVDLDVTGLPEPAFAG
jgi:L-arabinonolactonase